MKKLLIAVFLGYFALAQPGHRVGFGITPALQYPYGMLPAVFAHVDYSTIVGGEAVVELLRFGVFPVPFVGVLGDAQYRRYFRPLAPAAGASAGYWNVGWIGSTHDTHDDNLLGLYTGVGYERMFGRHWSAQLELDFYPLAFLDGVTTPGSWGLLFSFGGKVAATYRF